MGVIKEYEEKTTPGKYYALGGLYFYVNDGKMCLAEKKDGEIIPNYNIDFPSTKELSAEWTEQTKEFDDPNVKGKELKFLGYNKKMQNAMKYGEEIHKKNEPISNFGAIKPIVFYSQRYEAPTLGGFVVGTNYPDSVEGNMVNIEGKKGNKIFFQQSAFNGKYGISLEVSMYGQPINLEDFGIKQNMLKLPKTYNVGDFFEENSATPKFLEKASFLEGIKDFVKNGGRINKVTIEASTSKIPAGHVDNNVAKNKWKELNEYNDTVYGNNDDGTGNLQLCKHKAYNTYNALKKVIPELANAPYILKAAGPMGEYVHVKFE
jgi:hypothetical protein